MSHHEGVSCDSCLKGNFRGRRYKCLICYDYDLCAACYEAGATNTRHTTDHPMQCILTRSDFDVYYGGEALSSLEMPQSYTCPYCSRMGFTDVTLQEHVHADHQDTNFEVVCPLCAAMPGGDPNLMTDDFAGHLSLEHRSGPRDLISLLDEPVATRQNVRRIPHNSSHSSTPMGRGAAALRSRRSNMHFSVFSFGGHSSLSPSSRESVDPIAELLSQLSGVRRSTSSASSSTPTQLQQLQMQLQLERQQVNAARQQLERYPRRQAQGQAQPRDNNTTNCGTSTILLNASPVLAQPSTGATSSTPQPNSQFLLSDSSSDVSTDSQEDSSSSSESESSECEMRYVIPQRRLAFKKMKRNPGPEHKFLLDECLMEEMSMTTITPEEREQRCRFVQELILSTLAPGPGDMTAEEQFKAFMDSFRPSTSGESDGEKPSGPPRQTSTVLRGRARSDNQNAKRRAEANRKDKGSEPEDSR